MRSWQGPDSRGDEFVVREAEPRDAPRFLEHIRSLVEETHYMLQSTWDPLPDPQEQRLFLERVERLPNCLCLVAVRPGARSGRAPVLGSLTLLGGQTSRTRHATSLGMGVRREVWRRGIGRQLLDVALTWAYNSTMVRRVGLQVYGDNHTARRLYASRGFVEEGILRREVRLDAGYEDLVGMSADVERRPW